MEESRKKVAGIVFVVIGLFLAAVITLRVICGAVYEMDNKGI
jgi:hypothetical protein